MIPILNKIKTNKRILVYISVGVLAFMSEYLSFIIVYYLTPVSYALLLSQTISFCLGLLVSFNGNRLLTFKDNKNVYKYNTKQQLGLYLLLAIVNLFLSYIIIFILIHKLLILPLLSKLIVMVMVVGWNFFVLNRLVFNTKK